MLPRHKVGFVATIPSNKACYVLRDPDGKECDQDHTLVQRDINLVFIDCQFPLDSYCDLHAFAAPTDIAPRIQAYLSQS